MVSSSGSKKMGGHTASPIHSAASLQTSTHPHKSAAVAAWSALARDDREDAELLGWSGEALDPRLYSSEALAAVGSGRSPSFSLMARQRPPGQHRYHGSERDDKDEDLSAASSQSLSLQRESHSEAKLPSGQARLTTVRVLRGRDLPECLGGTNAYLSVEWGGRGRGPSLGKATTQCVSNSTCPAFGAALKFRSPFTHWPEAASPSPSPQTTGADTSLPSLYFRLFNKNASVSDELLASAELSVFDVLQENFVSGRRVEQAAQDVHSIELRDASGAAAGTVEIIIEF